jgi:asparagine synthase (glutamine-hydrolysing)
MWGIAGAIAFKSNAGNLPDPLDRIVERISQHLMHRGPDASGLWRSPSARVALAHRRLAVIDLTDTGRQPMAFSCLELCDGQRP